VPPELRPEIERLMQKAKDSPERAGGRPVEFSAKMVRTTSIDGFSGSKTEVIRFRDADGTEHVYNSAEEMPPEIRAIYERIQGESP
jgi:hypothetical protein